MSEFVRHGITGDSPERVVVQILDHPGNAPLGHHLEERGGDQHCVRSAVLGDGHGLPLRGIQVRSGLAR